MSKKLRSSLEELWDVEDRCSALAGSAIGTVNSPSAHAFRTSESIAKSARDEKTTNGPFALLRADGELRKLGGRDEAQGGIDRFTPREIVVLRFLAVGLPNKQIAAELRVDEKTIKVYRGRLMEKVGATSIYDLVRIFQRAGIAPGAIQDRTKVAARTDS